MSRYRLLLPALLLLCVPILQAREPIRLANNPSLSPDGSALAFDWNGDIWIVPIEGGTAKQLTVHPARDREPKFSPDGKDIAFTSDREGSTQAFVMPASGGAPRQLTHHTAGHSLLGWFPDGQSLLVSGARDHFWRQADRMMRISVKDRRAEEVLFDDYGQNGAVSPDGKRLLFTREGAPWWRKGYHGSQGSQIWLYDLEAAACTRVIEHERGCLWPLWKPDGKGFYYVGAQSGSFNLREFNLESRQDTQLTRFEDDSVVFPCISRDGSTLVFRRLFDLYSFKPKGGSEAKKIEIFQDGDRPIARKERRTLDKASAVSFSTDGLEVAFIAGGDVWVMDTELREPRQITTSAEEEREPVFSPDGDSILFVSDMNGQTEIWKAERTHKQKYWFQNTTFKLERLTGDGEVKSGLSFSPDGSRIAYIRGRGDLWTANADGKNAKLLIPSWNAPDYDWSPDGKWLVYAIDDNDFNRDIWLIPTDGTGKPFNLSRHPYNEHHPVWSPDGKLIAFTGQRAGGGSEGDICYVWLRAEDEEKDARDRAIEKALEKLNKIRKPGTKKPEGGSGSKDGSAEKDDPKASGSSSGSGSGSGSKKIPDVTIDFEGIHERIHRIGLAEGAAGNLAWSPDSNRIAFTATIESKLGTYTIDIPEDPKPKLLTTQTGTQVHWIKQGNQLAWLSGGLPGSYPAPAASPRSSTPAAPSTALKTADAPSGTGTSYRFSALQEVDIGKRNAAAFDLCWRTMRDNYYDEKLGNRDWIAIRKKYQDMAGQVPDAEGLTTVVNLMLGELNGSHLGFFAGTTTLPARRNLPGPSPDPAPTTWAESTAHLGLRFATDFKGPGLKVRDVLPDGPTDHRKSKVLPGEIVLSIDDTAVDPSTDLTTVLNGPLARDIVLKMRGNDGKDREITIRPISYTTARTLLYRKWIEDNRKMVDEASKGTLGYLHIAAMDMSSFHRFEEELYSVGAGKEGLVIDVRENGGGSTTDHLLTALTQPVHSITVPRGGGQGYPQDRKVYTTWNKPIVVLCNQNSFSNAEIFSHAIKTLKRGQLVGVPTAGGVISTGGTAIMDVGFLRLPFRGWYTVGDGQDMELHGAVPDHIAWPQPGQMPHGKDVQLTKGVDVLLADVEKWKAQPRPELKKASER